MIEKKNKKTTTKKQQQKPYRFANVITARLIYERDL